MSNRLFDRIVENAEEVVNEELLAIIEEDTKAKFACAVREGRKEIIEAKKVAAYEKLDLNTLDIDAIAEAELLIEDNERKIDKIKDIYKKWFDEDMK